MRMCDTTAWLRAWQALESEKKQLKGKMKERGDSLKALQVSLLCVTFVFIKVSALHTCTPV